MGAEKLKTVIKQIIGEYLENAGMSDLVYGTFTGAALRLDNKPMEIPLDMVDIPLHLQKVEAKLSTVITEGIEIETEDESTPLPKIKCIKLTDVPVTLQTGLDVGQKVAVVQQRGSQRYSIIDRV